MTSGPRTTISPRCPAGSRLPVSSMIATVVSGVGRPAEANRSRASVPSARRWSFGASVVIIIGASVCPNSWPSTGPIAPMACSRRSADIGAAPYHRHCIDDKSACASPGWSSSR
jgi:hypothetical protein